MWPFIPVSEIDWSPTIAGFSALVAAIALGWNVFFSLRQQKRLMLARVAEREFQWIENFRSRVAVVSANIVHVKNMHPQESPEHKDELRKLLSDVGHIELMFEGDDSDHVKSFLDALGRLRSALSTAAVEQMGLSNSRFRTTANEVIKKRINRAYLALRGKELK